MRTVILASAIVLLGACAEIPRKEPYQIKSKTVSQNETTRISAHGRWRNSGTKCFAKRTPRVRVVESPAHGTLDVKALARKPKTCNNSVEHAAVYYTGRSGYLGTDKFSYLRINPDSGKSRLILVNITVEVSSKEITEIQSLLADLGFEPGPADGKAGPQTRRAIESYQQAKGLEITGKPNGALLSLLRSER